jgi:hypothetical protein
MSGINELKQLNQRLTAMLADPHPGISTWRQVLSGLLMEMADYAGHGFVSAFPELLEACRTALTEVWDGDTLGFRDALSATTIREKCQAALAKATGEEVKP